MVDEKFLIKIGTLYHLLKKKSRTFRPRYNSPTLFLISHKPLGVPNRKSFLLEKNAYESYALFITTKFYQFKKKSKFQFVESLFEKQDKQHRVLLPLGSPAVIYPQLIYRTWVKTNLRSQVKIS